ncbi:MAG TPA: hypothetical protein VFS80_00055 [Burkholderiales bacterium]|nr:hypothetical protein [Burkholderiales bacterium]
MLGYGLITWPKFGLVDGWLVRFSPGKATRARCVNPISAGRLPLVRKLSLCQQMYDELQLPMLIRMTPFSQPPGLDAMLERAGMGRIDDTRVMVCGEPERFLSAAQLPAGLALVAHFGKRDRPFRPS